MEIEQLPPASDFASDEWPDLEMQELQFGYGTASEPALLFRSDDEASYFLSVAETAAVMDTFQKLNMLTRASPVTAREEFAANLFQLARQTDPAVKFSGEFLAHIGLQLFEAPSELEMQKEAVFNGVGIPKVNTIRRKLSELFQGDEGMMSFELRAYEGATIPNSEYTYMIALSEFWLSENPNSWEILHDPLHVLGAVSIPSDLGARMKQFAIETIILRQTNPHDAKIRDELLALSTDRFTGRTSVKRNFGKQDERWASQRHGELVELFGGDLVNELLGSSNTLYSDLDIAHSNAEEIKRRVASKIMLKAATYY